jgi:hypothetical protein
MLTTLSMAKKVYQIPEADVSRDDIILLAIEAATDAIEAYCKRSLSRSSHTLVQDGTGGAVIRLPDYPVHSIDHVRVDGNAVTDYELVPETGELIRTTGWPAGTRNIAVSYTAGYVTPDQAAAGQPATLPRQLELACILYGRMIFEGKLGLFRERLGDWSVEYAIPRVETKWLPPAVAAFISPYARKEG